MDKFVRTINTSDAYKVKMDQLNQELDRKVKEQTRLITKIGLGKTAGGLGLLTIGNILMYPSGLVIILDILILLVFNGEIPASEKENAYALFFTILVLSLIVFGIGALFRRSANKLFNKAVADIEEATIIRDRLTEEIEAIEDEINMQKAIFEQHMLNQQELISQEVRALYMEDSSDRNSDTKECPQCAETIKAKAKVCRYCNYSFEAMIDMHN